MSLGTFVITGGAGFIGSHLADALLAAGHKIRVLDDFSTGKIGNLDQRCEVQRGDVADRDSVRRALRGATGCFHLAAIASVARGNEDWMGTHRVNQTGTITVLDVARELDRMPVVYASSAAVYGDLPDVAREDVGLAPRTAYGADKLGSEHHARAAALVHGVPTLGFRFFNVYGPRQDPASPYSGVISIFARRVTDGSPVLIHGDGQQVRDFVYVGDVVEHLIAGMGLLLTSDELSSPVFNVCTGRETSVLDLARTLGDLCGRKPAYAQGPARAGDIRRSVGNPDLAIKALGVRARTTLAEGLSTTLESMRQSLVA